MPLAIVDCGTNIRRPTSRRAWTAASSQPAALVATSSAKRPRATIEAATNPAIATAVRSAAMEASAPAMKPAATTMETAATATATVETAATASAVTAAPVLSECEIC
jgi:hypothetical protein